MFSLNHKYKNDELLLQWINENNFFNENECLVQFFSGIIDEVYIKNIATILKKSLPKAHIIGVTTDGEIYMSDVTQKEIIISISVFHKSTLASFSIDFNSVSNSNDLGIKLASNLESEDIKAMVVFTSGLNINGDEFIAGVNSISNGRYYNDLLCQDHLTQHSYFTHYATSSNSLFSNPKLLMKAS